VTKIGIGSFIDPRQRGGRLNPSGGPSLIEHVTLRGQDWLLYPSLPIDCAILRGTTADEDGNITMEDEGFQLDPLAMAQAAHNSGGIVIVQVKRIVPRGSQALAQIRIPGLLVDHVVVCENPEQHGISYGETDNPTYTGQARAPHGALPPLPLTADKVIQRRAFLEMAALDHPVINLGIGIPAGIGQVAHEEGFDDYVATIESGVIGGVSAVGPSFGAAINPTMIVPQASQFDFYDGGGLDIAFLGMAELDVTGAVNVSKFGQLLVGVGGFANIAQSAKRMAYIGNFSTGGADIAVTDGRLNIRTDGRICKIVQKVELVSSAPPAEMPNQRQVFITERAVFAVRDGALTVTEYAPGIDIRAHLLERLPEGVKVADDLKLMDARLFSAGAMREAGQ
jgi:propionate CoA-transferase